MDRMDIFGYWNRRNGSAEYSRKLNVLFIAALKTVCEFPESGITTDRASVRAVLVRDYLLFYKDLPQEIYVLTIWDTRQDPNKLSTRLV